MNWINIKDRLPSDKQRVIFSDGESVLSGTYRELSCKDGFSYVHSDHWRGDFCVCCDSPLDVTHWIPFPDKTVTEENK